MVPLVFGGDSGLGSFVIMFSVPSGGAGGGGFYGGGGSSTYSGFNAYRIRWWTVVLGMYGHLEQLQMHQVDIMWILNII